jgi:hypothetical protein
MDSPQIRLAGAEDYPQPVVEKMSMDDKKMR